MKALHLTPEPRHHSPAWKPYSVLLTLTILCLLTTVQAQDTTRYFGRIYPDSNNSLMLTLQQVKDNDTVRYWLGSPDQTAEWFPISKATILDDSVKLRIKSLGATLTGRFDKSHERLEGKFLQNFQIFPVLLERYYGDSPYRRPQTPQPPFPYHTKEVTFCNPNTPYLFHGTLTLPKDTMTMEQARQSLQRNMLGGNTNPASALKHPAVVLVSGSGCQDRDETIYAHKPFAVIADQLTRKGIIVLRYDDRGYGSNDTNLYAGTTADFADDARCAIAFLKTISEVDTSKIGIIGHSEGGLIAEMLAAKQEVDFAILMAAPAISGKDVLATQTRYILEKQGIDEATIIKSIKQNEELCKQTNSINTRWLNYFAKCDPKPLLRQIRRHRVPTLVLQGDKDCQVLPAPNLRAMQRYLNNSSVTIRVYSDRNHLFQPCTTGLPSEYSTIETTIDLQVVLDMAAFIQWQQIIGE